MQRQLDTQPSHDQMTEYMDLKCEARLVSMQNIKEDIQELKMDMKDELRDLKQQLKEALNEIRAIKIN